MPFSKVTDPAGGAAELDLIVAIKVVGSFVAGLAGNVRRPVVVGAGVPDGAASAGAASRVAADTANRAAKPKTVKHLVITRNNPLK